MSKSKKVFIGVSIAVGILLIAAVIVIINFVIPQAEQTSHTVLAANYLLELDYNNAIAEYKLAIEIDPKNPDNYIGLAKAYSESGDDDAAEDVLNDALSKVDEPDKPKIQEALDNLLNQEPETTKPTTTTVATTTVPVTTTEITTTEQPIN
jgi:tetratricopeptide (TPR) repeat protein